MHVLPVDRKPSSEGFKFVVWCKVNDLFGFKSDTGLILHKVDLLLIIHDDESLTLTFFHVVSH